MPLSRGIADAFASGQGVGRRGRRRTGLAAQMGNIVKFPDEGRVVRFGRADASEESATVIILPVIRIERHDEARAPDAEPHTHPPADNGGRRRVRRR
jgi:hypothetical protein